MRQAIVAIILALAASTAATAEVRLLRANIGGVVTAVARIDGRVVVTGLDDAGVAHYWSITVSDGHIVAEPAEAPAEAPRLVDMLPDGVIVRGSGSIRRAWLAEPTQRYWHGVLGDDIEAGALVAEDAGGTLHRLVLGDDSVFEDRYPRLADVDGDGDADLVVVHSYLKTGAALAAYRLSKGGLVPLAESDPIGAPNRWLNPVGVADFDGDGTIELTAVVRPHVDGQLTLYRRDAGHLVVVQAVPGFSNHRIGSRKLGLSAVADLFDDPVPEIAVPNTDRDHLRIVSFAGGKFRQLAEIILPAEVITDIIAADINGDYRPELIYGLADGDLAVSVFAAQADQ